jgi:DNA-binding NarL/FixJ family response regulator
MITVNIIDDHRLVVEGLERLINDTDNDIRVSAKAYSITEGRKMLQRSMPDVLLLDAGLPDGDGVEFCEELHRAYPQLPVMMLTSYGEGAVVNRALKAGAAGYMLKSADFGEILEGIKTLAESEKFICREIEMMLKKSDSEIIELTRRERELLQNIVAGKSNIEIADAMCLGYYTIKSYRKNLLFKLNVHNTADLVRVAIEKKLV